MTELWVASIIGAALFFGAGLFAARRGRHGLAARMALERAVAEQRLAAGTSEATTLRTELAGVQAELARALDAEQTGAAEREAARMARQRLEAHLAAARADAAHHSDDARRLAAELGAARAGAEREREQAAQTIRQTQAESARTQAEAARTLEAARAERRASAGEVAAARQLVEALRGEVARLTTAAAAQASEIGALHGAAALLSAERDDLARRLLTLDGERDELAEKLDALAGADERFAALGAERDELLGSRAAVAAERDDLAVRVEALRGAQSELARAQADRRALLEEVGELRARVRAEPEPLDVEQLRHELVVTSELARARADEAGRVRDENVRLRERVAQLEDIAERFDALVDENDELRAQRFLAEPAPAPVPMPTANSWQQLVQRVSEVRSVRAAVITDELGLVVASAGDYSDVLAAYGRHLADEGQRVRELLPLRTIRELTVHDDRDVTMTVRPLPVADSKLALVTLGVGAEPEDDVRALLSPTLLEGR